MVSVTGYTAEHTDEVFNESIVSGSIDGDDLILTTRGGDDINAGNVRGPQGDVGDPGPSAVVVCTSTTRPSSPTDGLIIFETNTLKTLQWYSGRAAWLPLWNYAWGRIARATDAGSAFNSTSPTQVALLNVPLKQGRLYTARLNARWRSSEDNTIVGWDIQIENPGFGYDSLVEVRTTNPLGSAVNSSSSVEWSEPFTVSADATLDFRVVAAKVTSPSSTTTPSFVNLAIYDEGTA